MRTRIVATAAAAAVTAALSLASAPAFAGGFWIAGGKKNGEVSYAIGGSGERWGFEIGGNRDYDYTDDEVYDYPVPHSGWVPLGNKKIGPAIGVDVLYFVPVGTVTRLYVGVGGYMQTKAEVARSTATGWLYRQSEKESVNGAASAGVHFTAGKALLGVGYHTFRGPQAFIGISY